MQDEKHPSVKRRLAQIPKNMRSAYKAARTSRASAVKAMCQECCGYVRKEITNCTDVGCPMWTHRPYQKGNEQ